MKVVILCGGLGTRLKEETEYRPKPMVNIDQKPILWHIMKIYSHYGFKDFILCLGYKGEMIKEYFYNYEMLNNDFTIELGGHEQFYVVVRRMLGRISHVAKEKVMRSRIK
jgi:glucose-1-phosphate cytidylyltransferase